MRRFTRKFVVFLVTFVCGGLGLQAGPPASETTDRVQELTDVSLAHEKAGRIKEAIATCEQLLNLQRSTDGKVDERALETQRRLASLYETAGAFPSALEQREELLDLVTKQYGETHWRTIDARLDLDDSVKMSRLDLKQFKQLKEAADFYDKGLRYFRRGRYAESLNAFRQCLQTDEEILGPKHHRFAKDCQQIALAYKGVDEPGIAEASVNRAIEIQKSQLGEAHPEVGNSYNRLGIIQQHLKQYDDAIASYVKAGEIWKAAYGEKSGEFSASLGNLALVYGLKKDRKQAEQLLRDAVAIQEPLADEEDSDQSSTDDVEQDDESIDLQSVLDDRPPMVDGQWDYSETLANLGVLLGGEKKYDEAEPLLLRARELSQKYWGDDHPRYRWNLTLLANLAEQRATAAFVEDDFATAKKFGEQELDWMVRRYGEDHYLVHRVRTKLAEREFIGFLPRETRKSLKEAGLSLKKVDQFVVKKQLENALDVAQKAWNVMKSQLGEANTATIAAEDQVANVLIRQANYDQAEVHLRSIWNNRKRLQGDDPLVEPTRTKLITLLQHRHQRFVKEGKFDDAIKDCQCEIDLCVEAYGDKHWKTTDARVRKSETEGLKRLSPEQREQLTKADEFVAAWRKLDSAGNSKESVEPLQQAHDLYLQVLGPANSKTTTCTNLLGINRERLGETEKAEESFQQAWKSRRDTLGDEHPSTAVVAANLGHLISSQSFDQPAVEQAEKLLLDSIDVQRRTAGKQNHNYAWALNGLGIIYDRRNNLPRAEMYYREAQVIWQRIGSEHSFSALNNLARIYRKQHDLLRAEAMLKRVVEHHEKTRGTRPTELATALSNLSDVLHEQDKLAEAIEVSSRCVEIRRKSNGPKSPLTRHAVDNLAGWYSQLSKKRTDAEDFDGAREAKHQEIKAWLQYYDDQNWHVRGAHAHLRGIENREKLNPDQRKVVLQAENALREANVLAKQHKSAEAKQLIESAYHQIEPVVDSKDPLIASFTNRLGDLYRADKRLDQAGRMYRIELAAIDDYYGHDHPRYAMCLADLAATAEAKKDFVAAETFYKDSLALLRKNLSPRDHHIGDFLIRLTRFYERWAEEQSRVHNWNAAAVAYRQAWEYANQRYDRHPDKFWRIIDLKLLSERTEGDAKRNEAEQKQLEEVAQWVRDGNQLRINEKVREAIDVHQKAVDAYLKLLGSEDRRTTDARFWLALDYDHDTDYAAAEPIFQSVLEWRTRVLGELHPETARTLRQLGKLEMNRRSNYDMAEKHLVHSLDIFKKTLDKNDDQVASVLLVLAQVARSTDRLARAEELGRQAQEILQNASHENENLFAVVCKDLGKTYLAMGDYARAETQFRKSIDVFRIVHGERSLAEADTTINLGRMYTDLGDHKRAAAAYREAYASFKEIVGENHKTMATPLNLLGDTARHEGNLEQAETYYRQALEIQRRLFGLGYARCLSNVAKIHLARKEYEKADALLTEAFDIRKAKLPMQNGEYVLSLIDFAELRENQGDFPGAVDFLNQALEIYAKQLGHRHPKYATALRVLSRIERKAGRIDDATGHLNECLQIAQSSLLGAADSQSERQQLLLARSLRDYLDDYLSLAFASQSPGEQTYGHVLAWKGAVFARQLHARELNAARKDADPGLLDLYKKLEDVTSRLARSRFSTAEPVPTATRTKLTKELTAELEHLEAELAKRSAGFRGRKARESLTPSQLQACLPEDAALVDFLEYTHGGPAADQAQNWNSERRLVGFILRRGQPIRYLDLGVAAPVADAVDQWRAALQRKTTIVGENDPATLLRRIIWSPLIEHLGDAKTILISPDGPLCALPFAALPGEVPGTYVIEERAVSLIPVPQLLPEMLDSTGSFSPETSELLLMGNVDYGTLPEETAEQAEKRSSNSLVHPIFRPLDATAGEILVIKKHFEKRFREGHVELLEEDEATKRQFHLNAPRYHWLHLATHGFFSQAATANSRGSAIESTEEDDLAAVNPGLLSGLAMAGANAPRNPDEDDGILTALEVAQIDLRKVQLAVLSACESGLGTHEQGEGVLGLQRAFQVAGTRGVMASLWSVDDNATRNLMERFYENLWRKKMPRSQALREAQLWMLKEGQKRGMLRTETASDKTASARTPPYYWAPFVLSGDWR